MTFSWGFGEAHERDVGDPDGAPMIRAVLLDLGGPVFNEDAEYARWTELMLGELRREGVGVSPQAFQSTLEAEIARCEPHPWRAALWHWVKPDLKRFRRVLEVFHAGQEAFQRELPGVLVRPEARAAIPPLGSRYLLALAANQPPRALELLEDAGLLRFFQWREVSATMGVAKPHPLFFRIILDSLGVKAEEAVMVGDRLDHDIFPARELGLWTVRVLVGPYAHQKADPPSPRPHALIPSLGALSAVLERLG